MQKAILISFLLLCFQLTNTVLAQNNNEILKTPVTVSFTNKSIEQAIEIIAGNAGLGYSLGSESLSAKENISIHAVNEPLGNILTKVLGGTAIKFNIVGNQIVFKEIKMNQPQKITISGYVKEEGSKELLLGVNICIPELKIGTVTNTYGFYSITVPFGDSITLYVSFVGYSKQTIRVKANTDKELNINLSTNTLLEEVTIVGNQVTKQSEDVRMSTVNVPIQQIKSIPSLLGEKDVLKVIQLMPGVQKGGEGSSGFYVRGGSPDQNLIILDDAIVYNVSHLFGFFSLFNGDALKSVELTKGGFPARYGGRLSSVLELNMKEGNKQEWHGEAGIGLISSRFTLEGPLKKDKSSILISGRRTYADLIAMPFMGKEKFGYFFYDFNAKVNYDFGRNNKLYLSGYFGRDRFSYKNKSQDYNEKASFYWGNATGTLRWNHLFNNKLFSNTSLVYSKYKFLISATYQKLDENKNTYAEYYSGIQDFSVKYDVDYLPSNKHWIKTGFLSTYHFYEPHAWVDNDYSDTTLLNNYHYDKSIENAVYIEDTYHPFSNLKVNAGIRFTGLLTQKNQYWNFEPRFSVAWRPAENLAVKASYAEMNQYIHLLSNTGIGLPTDLWVPATDKVKPQNSKQVAFGIIQDIIGKSFSISVEGYYKRMNNIITYKEGASFIDISSPENAGGFSWENNVTAGKGKSYGVEFLLQRKIGKLSGWVGYTLSWTKLQFDSVNFGKEYYARYDRRHDISVVGIYTISPKITLSATWVYGTGNAVTMPNSEYTSYTHCPNLPGGQSLYNYWDFSSYGTPRNSFTEKNSFRMEPYHRFDIGIQFHKMKKRYERTLEISVYNAYNRHNPFYYYIESGYNMESQKEFKKLKKISLFPIIPSITYAIKF